MKLIFNHSLSVFNNGNPLIYLTAKRENESGQYMLENGWLPYYKENEEFWYQTKSSRLKLNEISKRRKAELSKIKITNSTNNELIEPIDLEYHNHGNFEDFFFDDIFWGRIHYFDNQVIYSVMNLIRSKKSYGTLSYYYLIDRFLGKFDYIYITDFFELFSYKKNLPGFEYWDGTKWI